jgi:hypothetical protein
MTWVWAGWLIFFVVLDTYAVTAGKLTFSHFVWGIENEFPRTKFVTPFVLGFVVCHFWWGK